MIIYLNGEFVPKEKAVVSVFDHGLFTVRVFEVPGVLWQSV